MKTLTLITVLFAASSAFAGELPQTACSIKQSNAASFQLAQSEGQKVQKVFVVGYDYGMWTEMPGENSGSDDVTVTVETGIATRIQKYTVSAKQIGNSADCEITGIEAKSL